MTTEDEDLDDLAEKLIHMMAENIVETSRNPEKRRETIVGTFDILVSQLGEIPGSDDKEKMCEVLQGLAECGLIDLTAEEIFGTLMDGDRITLTLRELQLLRAMIERELGVLAS